MNHAITIIIGVLSTIAAIISIYAAFPPNLSPEQQIQLSIAVCGWILAICFFIAFKNSTKKNSNLLNVHKADLKALKSQHLLEKATIERDLAKGYESFLVSELSKTSTALVYTSQLLNPASPIPKASYHSQGKNNDF